MPRRKRQSKAESVQAEIKPTVPKYLAVDRCCKDAPGYPSILRMGYECGCRDCHPEIWCEEVDEDGRRCWSTGRKTPEFPDKTLCRFHWHKRMRGGKQNVNADCIGR